MKKCPRVLVISPTRIGCQTATGSLMGTFFRGWPKDAIAQIHSDRTSELSYEVCEQYYYLKCSLKGLPRITRYGQWISDMYCSYRLPGGKNAFNCLYDWCRRFEPEVMYSRAVDRPTSYSWLPLSLSEALGIPLVTHIMDDWPSRLKNTENRTETYFLAPRILCLLRKTLVRSAVCLSICQKMSMAFEKRYRREFLAFHNTVDKKEWSLRKKKKCEENQDIFRAVYCGSIAQDMQLQSLRDIAEVISSLHGQGHKICMDIYTAAWWYPVFERYFQRLDGIRYGGFVPKGDYPSVLMASDLLVLPINFDWKSISYVRYSMANKGPEYMASGNPVLVYGPRGAATVDYACSDKWATVVTERNAEKLKEAILRLMTLPNLRAEMGRRSRAKAFKEHDAAIVGRRFRELLAGVAYG